MMALQGFIATQLPTLLLCVSPRTSEAEAWMPGRKPLIPALWGRKYKQHQLWESLSYREGRKQVRMLTTSTGFSPLLQSLVKSDLVPNTLHTASQPSGSYFTRMSNGISSFQEVSLVLKLSSLQSPSPTPFSFRLHFFQRRWGEQTPVCVCRSEGSFWELHLLILWGYIGHSVCR